MEHCKERAVESRNVALFKDHKKMLVEHHLVNILNLLLNIKLKNQQMKYIFLFVAVTMITGLIACTKESNGIQLQLHNENRMMDTMHTMMSRMEIMPKTNDPEIDFSKMMIMHHQGAINMANVQLQQGKNDSLKRISKTIIATQQKEIQQFNSILSTVSVDNIDPIFTKEQMANMMKGGKVADVQIITGDIDNDFATLMMIHHQGAIDNASAYLHHGNNTQLKNMAQTIMDAQVMEIQELSNWLKANKR